MSSKKMGRPPKENPKKISLGLRLSDEEADMIQKCADAYGVTRTEVILMGIRKLLAEK